MEKSKIYSIKGKTKSKNCKIFYTQKINTKFYTFFSSQSRLFNNFSLSLNFLSPSPSLSSLTRPKPSHLHPSRTTHLTLLPTHWPTPQPSLLFSSLSLPWVRWRTWVFSSYSISPSLGLDFQIMFFISWVFDLGS